MKAQNFIFIGRSGCGKGTQASNLTEYLKKIDPSREVFYLQTGAEFREFIQGDTYTQKLSKKAYVTGELQPEFLAVWMWSHILIEKFKGDEHLITDGSPRKFHEAGTLDSIFSFYGREKPYLIFINTSREEAIKRLEGRKRLDDSATDVIKRMDWYDTDVAPALNFYRNNPNYTFLEINGDQSPELVWQSIQDKLALDV
jgi:adenylate kinase family enzyme